MHGTPSSAIHLEGFFRVFTFGEESPGTCRLVLCGEWFITIIINNSTIMNKYFYYMIDYFIIWYIIIHRRNRCITLSINLIYSNHFHS
jgi:hypothetical protein